MYVWRAVCVVLFLMCGVVEVSFWRSTVLRGVEDTEREERMRVVVALDAVAPPDVLLKWALDVSWKG